MNTPARLTLVVAAVAAAAALLAGGFLLGRHLPPAQDAHALPHEAPPAAERRVLYWHDPMVPGPRFDQPGKSPFMDMDLVPVYEEQDKTPAGTGSGSEGVRIDPAVQQNLGIRLATVTRRAVAPSLDAVGTVQFDERLAVAVQTRVAGFVEHLAVRAPMEQVRAGQALATVFAPDWLGPQNEWLALKAAGVAPELVAAARERLRALSIPDALVRRSEAAGSAQARFTLQAPVGGVVAELGVREGMAVAPGTTLFRLAGLASVWAVAELPEAQAGRLVHGQRVTAALQADPGVTFDGRLEELLPQVSASTRTRQARFAVANPGGRLTPGQLLRLQISAAPVQRLVVPLEAVIRTGTRTVAVVRQDDGRFAPRELRLGVESGEQVEVLQGLAEGEQVVASGQFLVDSEARLKSVLGVMTGTSTGATTDAAPSPPAGASR